MENFYVCYKRLNFVKASFFTAVIFMSSFCFIDLVSAKKTANLRFFFAGTNVRPRLSEYSKDALRLYPNRKNVLFKKSKSTNEYNMSCYFPGALSQIFLDEGSYSIENNRKNGGKIIFDKTVKLLENGYDKIKVTIIGHSRGGVSATDIGNDMQKKFKGNEKVHIKVVSLDPVPGPGHSGDDVFLNFDCEKNENVIIYAMFAPIFHEPQEINNAKIYIIVPKGHIEVFGTCNGREFEEVHDRFYFNYKQNLIKLNDLSTLENGIYLSDHNHNLTKIEKNNLPICINSIYENFNRSGIVSSIYDYVVGSYRIKVLLNKIEEKLKININEILLNDKDLKKKYDKLLSSTKGIINPSSVLALFGITGFLLLNFMLRSL
ncbi:MAG: hypothetical protein FWC41_04230 [Firmicutes bacterium]|nr:hypothetical protein [Bacillota bacterium]